ncbi:hypothetical protein AB4Y87_22155 [Paenarthrobacter sp. RAF54_2]
MNEECRSRNDLGRLRQLKPTNFLSQPDSGQPADIGMNIVVRKTIQAAQVRPLILVWFEGRRVEEYRGAMLAAFAVQRRSNQVAHAFARVNVLGGKEPVITSQVHAPA